MNSNLLLYNALTPMHMGAGNKIGTVDMPIQREGHTNFPKMEASGIKGVFRDRFERLGNNDDVEKIFGSENTEEGNMGSVNFTDAKILFFPMRSYKGVFALVTCPMVLKRFMEDISSMQDKSLMEDKNLLEDKSLMDIDFKTKSNEIYEQLKNENKDNALVYNQSEIIYSENQENSAEKPNKVMVEEFIYDTCEIDSNLKELVNKIICDDFKRKRILIVPDLDFRDYVEMYTEVNTRIRIENNGVVKDGALFTEEYLPAESIMYGFISENSMRDSEKYFETFTNKINENQVYQFGGNATIGKGITKVVKK